MTGKQSIGSRTASLKLEHRAGVAGELLRICFHRIGERLALDHTKCLAIREECGFMRGRTGMMIVDFIRVPDGLNARELEQYLREHGSEMC